MEFKLNLYRLREGRDMKPSTFANLVSTSLYEKRFSNYFVTPIVIGVEEGKAVICTYDSIGAMDKDNFAGSGYLFQWEEPVLSFSTAAVSPSINPTSKKRNWRKYSLRYSLQELIEMLSADGEE